MGLTSWLFWKYSECVTSGVNRLTFFLSKGNCLLPLCKGEQRAPGRSCGYFKAHLPKPAQEHPVPVLTGYPLSITASMALLKQVKILACNKVPVPKTPYPPPCWLLGGQRPSAGASGCSWCRAAEDTDLTCPPLPFSPTQEPRGFLQSSQDWSPGSHGLALLLTCQLTLH